MITCERAAEWTSRALDDPLPGGRRFALGFHRLLCPQCRRFRDQLAEVENAVSQFLADGDPPVDGLSDDARQRIRLALENETSG
jgi:hypothetical protein